MTFTQLVKEVRRRLNMEDKMEQAKVVSDARHFCSRFGCCLTRAEEVEKADISEQAQIKARIEKAKAQQDVQERNQYVGGSCGVAGGASREMTARELDAQIKNAQAGCSPMAEAKMPAQYGAAYNPIHYSPMDRLRELEERERGWVARLERTERIAHIAEEAVKALANQLTACQRHNDSEFKKVMAEIERIKARFATLMRRFRLVSNV